MNKGVAILLARMDSNPDEFEDMFEEGDYSSSRKWEWIIQGVLKYVVDGEKRLLSFLTPEEVNAIHEKYISIQSDNFTKHIMKQLLDKQEYTSNSAAWTQPDLFDDDAK